ncbi:MAG: Crp/Fnr family transcriptional regulator [Chromatiales bacterium]|nr:Crp/Fnr family transcriptional regulator [Chromatiales bacterium]
MTHAVDITSALSKAFPFLAEQDEAFLSKLSEAGTLGQLGKSQVICGQGRDCTHLALILEGTARVYKLGDNGREITLYRIGPGESCILTASCILSQEPFPAIAVSESEVTALLLPAKTVTAWLAESAVWRDYVFGLVAKRLSNIISIVEEVAFKRMDRRIAAYLLDNITVFKRQIQATHQEIASDLGTSREVVSRILKDLEHAQLIQISRGTIKVINPSGLKQKTTE